jgi:hypothetical protein
LVSDIQLGSILLENLAELCGLFASGLFPQQLAPFYGGARLIPFMKKDQSAQIKSRARSFGAISLFDIVDSIMEDSLHLEHQKETTSIKLRNVKRFISLGRLSDAIKMLQSNGVHPINTKFYDRASCYC